MTPGALLGLLVIGLMLATTLFLLLLSEIDRQKELKNTEKRIRQNDKQCEPWYEQFAPEQKGKKK